MRFHGNGDGVSPVYRFTDVSLWPRAGGKAVVDILWSKVGEFENSNMHQYSSGEFDPARAPLIVFLPQKDGNDHFDYAQSP